MSRIEWTEKSLSCVTGCTKFSPGCRNCYARSMTRRLQGVYEKRIAEGDEPLGFAKYALGFDKVCFHPEVWQAVKKWKPSTMAFLNPMADTFNKDVSLENIIWMFEMMNYYDKITWQVLTKRSERMEQICNDKRCPVSLRTNIWMGVSVENQDYVHRIKDLAKVGAKVKFVSFEPLLRPIDLTGLMWTTERIEGVVTKKALPFQWAIIGCETGSKPRPMQEEWVRDLIRQLKSAGVKVFYKQKLVDGKKVSCPEIDGRQWMEYPGEVK